VDLNDILVFAKVVDNGSFVGASRELGMPKSTVSRKLSELEAALGVRLLQRTTRKLSLTDAGRAYYEHAARVVAEAEEAAHAVTRLQEAPRGLLRVTAPVNLGFLASMVVSFMRRYHEVRVELVCTDRLVNLVDEGFDVAMRVGTLVDSTLVARSLGTMRSALVAAPSFVRDHGMPETPAALERLDALAFGAGEQRASIRLYRGEKPRGVKPGSGEAAVVKLRARLTVNDFEFLEEGVRVGLGFAVLPLFRCIDDLRRKKLVRLLPDWHARESPLQAVYPSARHLSPKVKAFLDHLVEQMTPPPWERGPYV
jgi:DNA-binding transcriptional LysR family regulator